MAGSGRQKQDGNVREPGRFAYEGLERVIHEKARLSIMSSLATHPEGLLFNDLKDLCSLTDGNHELVFFFSLSIMISFRLQCGVKHMRGRLFLK